MDTATPTGAFAEANGPVVAVTMDFGARSAARSTASSQR